MKLLPLAAFAVAGIVGLATAGVQAAPPTQPASDNAVARAESKPSAASAAADQSAAASESTPASPSLTTLERADILMARKQYRDAIDTYERAITETAGIYNKIGIAYHSLSDLKAAERSYKEALKVKPDFWEAWNNLGALYYARKDYKKAISQYATALKYAPDSASLHSNLGTAYFARKKYDDAMKEYQTALKLDPTVFDTRNTHGSVLQERSVEDRAKFYFYLARAYARAGIVDLAIQNLRKALEGGYDGKKEMESDKDFAALRELPEFQELLKLEPRVL